MTLSFFEITVLLHYLRILRLIFVFRRSTLLFAEGYGIITSIPTT